ncbi:hypothetical protein [Sulfuricurvum sp.]|uniref:hypothetical protein n=1 Tax=Sulfuricurvum sp. TaxID=2025608 RepID=UPI0019B141AD|nr:hypothetical protein [Sulfuricurvum sp.]MBD3799221.1 hypothetical protein [Campylobacterota bacterium]MBD3806036.1 hypothetical protein [Sulfuricurvum sp.]
MLSKWVVALLASIIGLSVWIFFHPSYQKSLEARFYYMIGEYTHAYERSNEAFLLDPYNRMASTIMAQSTMAMKYVRYNEDARKYKKEIYRIAAQPSISDQERSKIKMMTNIVIDGHGKLASTVVIDRVLIDEANEHYRQFKKLHDELVSPR